MKKKILTLCLVVCLAATAIVGGTLAYFTDTDAQTNTFTTGNVEIDLFEDFGDNNPETLEKLVPATGSAQAGTLQNHIEKEVYVENTGSEDAYVRIHFAIPQVLDNGDPDFDASANIVHWNFAKESIVDGMWSWTKTGTPNYDAEEWNYYEVEIDGIAYNVYVATYETALKHGEITPDAVHQVYMDPEVTNEDITKIKNGEGNIVGLGDTWNIYVAAEGIQKAGFGTAYEALNTEFGNPSASDYVCEVDWNTVTGKTWVQRESVKGVN